MTSVDELKDLGNKAFASGNFKQAVEHFTEAISLDSSNHVLFSNRSAAFASLKKYKEALADAEKTVSINPGWAKGYSRLGAAHHGLQNLEEAEAAYKKGLEIEPENKACKDGVAAVAKQLKEQDKSGMDSLSNAFAAPDALDKLRANPETKNFMNDPDFVSKIQANPSMLQMHMKDQRILQAMLVLMGLSGSVKTQKDFKPEEFNVEEDEEEEIHADKPTPAAAKPAAKPAEKPAEKPQSDAEPMDVDSNDGPKVSAADKAKAAAEKEQGTAAYKKKDFETALKHYNAAAALDPTDLVYLLNISAVYFEQKEFDKCIETALKAAEVGEQNKGSFEALGKAYARASKAAAGKGDLESAIKYIGKALTNHRNPEYIATQKTLEKDLAEQKRRAYLDPEKAAEHKNKGNDLFKAGDFPGAVKEYSEAIKRNPDDSKVYGNRAACYIKLAAFPLAIEDCDAAIKLEPTFIKAFIRKGNALMAMKKYSEAQSALYKALELDSNNAEATEAVAKCRQALHGGGMTQKERAEQAMKDPEVQKIMGDPVMQAILQQMVQDPKAVREHLKDPAIAANIQRLIDAGILSMG